MTIREMLRELSDRELVDIFEDYPKELCNACILMSLEDQIKKENN
jgi:hypothetical protein